MYEPKNKFSLFLGSRDGRTRGPSKQRGIFWITFLIWIGSQIAMALLVKPKVENARPSGLDDFQFPTATEGRALSIIVGKVKVAPNVVWYGDLKTIAIKEKVGGFLGIGGKNVTKAYKYYVGVQMALCSGPIDGIDRVWMGDKVIKTGETGSTSIVLDDAGFFGGDSRGGGIKFTLNVYLGTTTQTANSYLAAFQTPTPAYTSVAYLVLSDGAGAGGYIGDNARLSNLQFEPYWYPNSLGATGGKHRIGDDANPICFLYEILSNNLDWGLAITTADVLITGTAAAGALRAVAEQVADEGLGFSMVIDRQMETDELIREIERHVDGVFRLDLVDGKYKIVLARPPPGSVPNADTSNSKLISLQRGMWSQTKNEVRIAYTDRAKEYNASFAADYDLANLEITGQREPAQFNFPGVRTAVVANKIAARELSGLSFPLAKVTLEVNRTLWKLQRGDAFDFSWPDEGIVNLPLRVMLVVHGDDQSAKIQLEAMEDVFRLEVAGFVDPPATGWTPPSFAPVAALDARIWEPPAGLSVTPYQPLMLAARNGGLQLEYDLYTDLDGGTTQFQITNEAVSDWTPAALLNGAIDRDVNGPPHYTHTLVIDGLVDITSADIIAAAAASVSATDPKNVVLIDDELMWYSAASVVGGGVQLTVRRGGFGTIPLDHADNARVWFPTLGAATILGEGSNLTLGSSIRCRVLSRTAVGTLLIASAPNIPSAADYVRTGAKPYSPGDAKVSARLFVDENWTKAPGVLRVTWNPRNPSQSFSVEQETTGIVAPSSAFHQVQVKRVDTDAVVSQVNNAPTGAFNASKFIAQSTPGVPAELDYYIELKPILSGVSGQLWKTQNFEVIGFGIDFGGDFGGQQLSSDPNLGYFLKQGAAPIITDPVPGLGQDREWRLDVLGTWSASDNVTLRFVVWDSFLAEFETVQFSFNGGSLLSLDAYAANIETQLLAAIGDRQFTISRTGTQIFLSTRFGDVSFSSVTGGSTNYVQFSMSVLQTQAAALTPVNGNYALDWWTQTTVNGDAVEVLSPSNDPAFIAGTEYGTVLRIASMSYARELQIRAVASSSALTFFARDGAVTDRYDASFQDATAGPGNGLMEKIRNSPLGQFIENLSVGTITGGTYPMARNALILQMVDNVRVPETFYDAVEGGYRLDSTEFRMLVKPVTNAVAGSTSGFKRMVSFNFYHGQSVGTGLSYVASLDGTAYTQAIGGTGSGADQISALTALTATIEGLSAYNATFEVVGNYSTLKIEHNTANTYFDCYMHITAGARFEFHVLK